MNTVAELNDHFRRTARNDIYVAGELAELDAIEHAAIMGRVRHFKDEEFDKDCPDHSFLAFSYGDRKIFAKIDYYNQTRDAGMDPMDPACRRIMTIYVAEDH